MNIPVSVWIDYFKELPVEQAIEELSAAGFTHGELSIVHLEQLMAKPHPAAIGVIGGADGPTAVIMGVHTPKLHAACSSLHFEAVEAVEWRAVFSEKLMEDIEVCLL